MGLGISAQIPTASGDIDDMGKFFFFFFCLKLILERTFFVCESFFFLSRVEVTYNSQENVYTYYILFCLLAH